TRFLLARGFRLEQVERMSRLDLPLDADAFDRMLGDAESKAGEYHLERFAGPCPEKWISGLGLLRRRMSTDAPSAGLDFAEEEWTDERVRSHEALKLESPRVVLTTLAVHAASGQIAGFTELSMPPEIERPVQQNDTLVLKEHRGHRLGMLLKLANLRYLDHTHPGHPAVTTFNAEENRPMLEVNEAMGFVAVGYGGGWKKAVETAS
ncbi:MAG TPA: GNAT family N-acetyltransferase, partial [Terrimesophilobacter sp.]|nr:GNAT family N-acetyltransferase [Terrimesophilobacter sp.]